MRNEERKAYTTLLVNAMVGNIELSELLGSVNLAAEEKIKYEGLESILSNCDEESAALYRTIFLHQYLINDEDSQFLEEKEKEMVFDFIKTSLSKVMKKYKKSNEETENETVEDKEDNKDKKYFHLLKDPLKVKEKIKVD